MANDPPSNDLPEEGPPATDLPADHRAGFVGIVGRPNVGKSTLMNRLLGTRLAITTPKPQTTRDRIKGIQTFDDWQVAFVDTPGIHEPRTRLNRYMVDLAVSTLSEVDLTYLMVDTPKLTDSDPSKVDARVAEVERIVEHIKVAKSKTLLLLNKVDLVKDKGKVLTVIERLAPLHTFEAVIPISARRGTGEEALLEETRKRLPPGPRLFDEDTLTDRPMRFIAGELIREQAFMALAQELPYNCAVSVLSWKTRPNGVIAIHANIHVSRKSHKPIVVGRGASQIKAIGSAARRRIEELLERRVYLDLRVKVDEGWLDRPSALRELGYDETAG